MRASTISSGVSRPATAGQASCRDDDPGRPLPKPRRAMSVSGRDKRPHPLPRLPSQTEEAEDGLPEIESTYSTPYTSSSIVTPNRRNLAKPSEKQRSRVSSVSSTSSLSSTSSSFSLPSSPSSPGSPQLQQSLSPEQFWAKYRRRSCGAEPRKFRSLFASLSLSDTPQSPPPSPELLPCSEPVYSEIYGAAVRPPLPRKNSVSKPPARPPLPADKQRVQSARAVVGARGAPVAKKDLARV